MCVSACACVCLPGTRLVSVVGQTAWLCSALLVFICFSCYRFKLWAANKVWACNQKQIHLTYVSVADRMIKTELSSVMAPPPLKKNDNGQQSSPNASIRPHTNGWGQHVCVRATHPYKQIWHITSLTCCPLCGLLFQCSAFVHVLEAWKSSNDLFAADLCRLRICVPKNQSLDCVTKQTTAEALTQNQL